MVQFNPVRVAKITESIVEAVEEMLLDGTLKPGDRLPPERDLAVRFTVSRPSLREALVVLESRGLLQSRRGGGTFVCDVVAPTITDPLVHLLRRRPASAFDVLELRHALEEVAAYYAAERASEHDLKTIAGCHARLVAAYADDGDPQEEANADTEFHLAVADASHNIALVHVMRGLFNLLRADIARNLSDLRIDLDTHQIVQKQHFEIFEAIQKREPEAAREAAHRHLAFIGATLRAEDVDTDADAAGQCG